MRRREEFDVYVNATPDRRRAARSSFAALGDSFTAGSGCHPGDSWADRLATELRARNPALLYRNLAVDGATSKDVLDQVGPALQLEPDLVSVICGGNDVLRNRRPDIEAYAVRLDSIFVALRELGELILITATAPTQWSFLGLGPRTAKRVEAEIAELNEATREVARARDALCLEMDAHPALEDPRNFSQDGLHPSALGHARTARAVAGLVEVALEGGIGERRGP
jgi:lysophospholipase L1-like esterase